MLHADISGELTTALSVGLVLPVIAFLILVLVIVAIIETARWSRRSALELKAIRELLEKRQHVGDDSLAWPPPGDRPSQHSA